MGDIVRWPRFMRRRREAPADDVSAAFTACCTALHTLSPRAREMVSGWLHERYRAQLEEDMQAAEDAGQPERDALYVSRISQS